MTADVQYKLFFLRGNRSFPDGTLFELKSEEPVLIPDRGDGRAVEVPLNSLIEISPFAENVPPAHCPVTITSINFGVPGDAVIDKTIHYQVIVVPLPSSQNEISGVKVMDRLRNAEADHYEASTAATENEIMEMLLRLNREGRTIIMVTHEPGVAKLAKRQIFMKDGVVAGEGIFPG